MKKRDWNVSIVAGLLLGGLLTLFNMNLVASAKNIALRPDNILTQIIPTVLNSHTHWLTLYGDAEVTWYGPNSETQTYFTTFEFSQPNKAHIETISKEANGNDGIWISNGEKTYELKKETKTYIEGKLPSFVKDLSNIPLSIDEINNDNPMPHPFAMFISSPVRDLIYPTEFFQSSQISNFELIGQETLLGRKVWVVTKQDSSGDSSTVWIDKATGIFLKYEGYLGGQKWMELFFTKININEPINTTRFDLPNGYQPITVP